MLFVIMQSSRRIFRWEEIDVICCCFFFFFLPHSHSQGDHFGERLFLGRPYSDGQYKGGKEGAELYVLSSSNAELMWTIEPKLGTAFWGHVALSFAQELRFQSRYQGASDNPNSADWRVLVADRLKRATLVLSNNNNVR